MNPDPKKDYVCISTPVLLLGCLVAIVLSYALAHVLTQVSYNHESRQQTERP